MDGSVLGVWKRRPGVALCPGPSLKRPLCRASVNPDPLAKNEAPSRSESE